MTNTRGFRFHGAGGLSLSAALAALVWLSGPAVAEEVGDQFEGEKLFDIGASPTAVLTYKQALVTLSLMKRSLERKQQLLKQQLATPEDVEKAERSLADAEATVKMLEKLLQEQ